MNVLITGVAGFVGKKLSRRFISAGHSVIGIYRNCIPQFEHPNIKYVRNDHLAGHNIFAKVDLIIDCASDIPAKQKNQDQLYENNINNIKSILKFASSKGVKKIIYMSSMSAFGEINSKVISTYSVDGPRSIYGESKFQCEEMLREWYLQDKNRSGVVIRLPGVIGVNSHNNFISDIYKNIKNNKMLNLYNKKSLFNNCIHIDTLSEFLINLADLRNKQFSKILVGSSSPITIENVIKLMMQSLNIRPQIHWGENNLSYTIDYSTSKTFGFHPITTRNAILKFIYEKNIIGSE